MRSSCIKLRGCAATLLPHVAAAPPPRPQCGMRMLDHLLPKMGRREKTKQESGRRLVFMFEELKPGTSNTG